MRGMRLLSDVKIGWRTAEVRRGPPPGSTGGTSPNSAVHRALVERGRGPLSAREIAQRATERLPPGQERRSRAPGVSGREPFRARELGRHLRAAATGRREPAIDVFEQ